MAYLTLTHDERMAIDWVGGRYFGGDDLYRLLFIESIQEPVEVDWDSQLTILFNVPAPVVESIREGWEAEGCMWPCFGSELWDKMDRLIGVA